MLNKTILYEPTGTRPDGLIAHSMLLVRVDNAREIVFYNRNLGFIPRASQDRASAIYELCDIAANQYIDCPRASLLVRCGAACVVLVRSLMRSTGLLMVLEAEKDSIEHIVSTGDLCRSEITVFDAMAQVWLPNKNESEKLDLSPYYMLLGAEVSAVQYARAVAGFVGCSLSVAECEFVDDCISCDTNTDVIGALLVMLILLFRRTTEHRLVEFEMRYHRNLLRVKLCATLNRGIDISTSEELAESERIARTRNIAFDYSVSDDNVASFEFCATDIEWSHLGIKARPELEYDE